MRHLALAALVAFLAAAAQAQPVEITGTDTVRFSWEPASGPVVAYEAKLIYLDGTESQPVIAPAPPHGFTPRKGIPFRLTVRACHLADTDLTVCDGEWSESSDEVRLCPLVADINCDLAVGAGDFVLLSGDWGEVADE